MNAQANQGTLPLPVRRKRAHKKRNNPLLPKRPKKAMTSYGIFLRQYFRDHPAENSAQARTVMRAASAVWKGMTPAERVPFEQTIAPDRVRFEREMVKWNQQKLVLKRPPSIYAMFLKEVWDREKDSGRDISTMGTYAAGLWKALSEDEKNVYRRRFEIQASIYRATTDAISTGEMSIDTIGGQLEEINFEMIPPPPGPAAAALPEQQNLDIVAPLEEPAALPEQQNLDIVAPLEEPAALPEQQDLDILAPVEEPAVVELDVPIDQMEMDPADDGAAIAQPEELENNVTYIN